MQTIYWKRKKEIPAQVFADAVKNCRLACNELEKNGCLVLTGFETPLPVFDSTKIEFNGKPGVEPFILNQVSEGRERNGQVLEFCKTHGLPYEKAVLTCLEIFKQCLNEQFEISSDG